MSLLHAAAARGRRMAEARFTETVTAGRYADSTDPVTGTNIHVLVGAASYEGPGQVKYPTLTVSPRDVASQIAAEQQILVKLPSGTVLHVGEEVHVTASTIDPSLVGARYRVAGQAQKGQTTAARYPVTELS